MLGSLSKYLSPTFLATANRILLPCLRLAKGFFKPATSFIGFITLSEMNLGSTF